MAESPGWSVFVRENGSVYHTYSRTAFDRFLLSPYYAQLLDQVPAGRDVDFPLRRDDGYRRSRISIESKEWGLAKTAVGQN